MREIKFRAYVPAERDMYYIEKGNQCWLQFEGDKVTLWEEYESWCSGSGEWESSESIREIEDFKLMQYTGLKDKNGQEIFEGDICTCELGINDRLDRKKFIVKYAHNSFILDSEYVTVEESFEYWEIIGNIHENPELLK
jgi:uncharacterized phage protein (TIGR01671 family)